MVLRRYAYLFIAAALAFGYVILSAVGVDAGSPQSPPSQATPTPLNLGDTVRGNIVVPGQVDIYVYTGEAGSAISLSVMADGSEFDPVIEVYGPDGSLVAFDDDGGDGYNAMLDTFVLPATGQYRIEVRGYRLRSTGAYVLTLTQATPPPTPVVGGGQIAIGESVRGDLPVGQRDTWTFYGEAGQIVTIAMTAEDTDLDTYLELRGPDGSTLAEDDDGGSGLNSLIEGFVLPVTGMYTIIARSYGDSSGGVYTLDLIGAEGAVSVPTPTPPLTTSQQGTIQFGQTVSGYISGQIDRWTFEGEAGTVITISLEAASGDAWLDTYLELYGPDGRLLIENDDGGVFFNSLIQGYQLPVTGQYTIAVRAYNTTSWGPYNLTLLSGDLRPTPIGGGGGTLGCGQTVRGNLGPFQVDTWQFPRPMGTDSIWVSFDYQATGGGNVVVFAFERPDGEGVLFWYDGSEANWPAQIPLEFPGTYWFEVAAFPMGLDSSGSYALTVECSQTTSK